MPKGLMSKIYGGELKVTDTEYSVDGNRKRKKKIDESDILARASTEALRLGMSYGQFAARCAAMFPDSREPIAKYFGVERFDFDDAYSKIRLKQGRSQKMKNCEWCGRVVTEAQPDGTPNKHAHFCSDDCARMMGNLRAVIYHRKEAIQKAVKRGEPKEAFRKDMEDLAICWVPDYPESMQPWIAREAKKKLEQEKAGE